MNKRPNTMRPGIGHSLMPSFKTINRWRQTNPIRSPGITNTCKAKNRERVAPAMIGPPVIFQDVVHSIGTGEADCDEQSSFRGQTEWTSTRMPDSRFAVERRWSKPSFAAWASAVPQPAFA